MSAAWVFNGCESPPREREPICLTACRMSPAATASASFGSVLAHSGSYSARCEANNVTRQAQSLIARDYEKRSGAAKTAYEHAKLKDNIVTRYDG